jgi:hypothetical protein
MGEGDALPVDARRLDARTFVGDVVLKPALTPLLAAARGRGQAAAPIAPDTRRFPAARPRCRDAQSQPSIVLNWPLSISARRSS